MKPFMTVQIRNVPRKLWNRFRAIAVARGVPLLSLFIEAIGLYVTTAEKDDAEGESVPE